MSSSSDEDDSGDEEMMNSEAESFTKDEFETLRAFLRRILNNAQSIADLAHDTPPSPTDTSGNTDAAH